jgi:hypothetical protein
MAIARQFTRQTEQAVVSQALVIAAQQTDNAPNTDITTATPQIEQRALH